GGRGGEGGEGERVGEGALRREEGGGGGGAGPHAVRLPGDQGGGHPGRRPQAPEGGRAADQEPTRGRGRRPDGAGEGRRDSRAAPGRARLHGRGEEARPAADRDDHGQGGPHSGPG